MMFFNKLILTYLLIICKLASTFIYINSYLKHHQSTIHRRTISLHVMTTSDIYTYSPTSPFTPILTPTLDKLNNKLNNDVENTIPIIQPTTESTPTPTTTINNNANANTHSQHNILEPRDFSEHPISYLKLLRKLTYIKIGKNILKSSEKKVVFQGLVNITSLINIHQISYACQNLATLG